MNLSIKELNELIYSLGITSHNGRFVNKDVNESLLERLYSELNRKIELQEQYDEIVKNLKVDEDVPNYIDEEVDGETINVRVHFVDNEEADEDVYTDYVPNTKTKERGWVAQAILDYVDEVGAATFTEMNEFYKAITLGSNSFTHILQNLRVPYKNRKTQRYLAKEGRCGSNAKWVVKVANSSNWVVANN